MRMFSLLLLFAVPAVAADDEGKKELDRLQGDWEAVVAEKDGEKAPAEYLKRLTFKLKGNELIPDEEPKELLKIELTPGKKPGWIDLTDKNGKTVKGIYNVNGNHWEFCVAGPGGERPTEFKTAKDSKTYLMKLKMKKKTP